MNHELAKRKSRDGFIFIELHPNSKIPVRPRWQESQTSVDFDAIRDDANIGVLAGRGFFILDVDVKEGINGWQRLAFLEAENGKLPDTFSVDTPSGGRHYYFKDTDRKVRCRKDMFDGVWSGLETKGAGGFVVFPPSIFQGKTYEISPDSIDDIAEPPSWLLDLFLPREHDTRTFAGTEDGTWEIYDRDHIAGLLGFVPPDTGREEWVQIGMALHSTGADWAFDLWDSWSRLGTKYDSKGSNNTRKQWESFKRKGNASGRVTMGSFFAIVRKYIIYPERFYEFEIRTMPDTFVRPEVVAQKPPSERFDEVHHHAHGIIGYMSDYLASVSFCSDTPFTMAGAITLAHAIVQKTFTCCGDILSQITICDGYSTGGKSQSIGPIENLLRKIDKEILLGRPTSVQGMVKHMGRRSDRLWMQDEWGDDAVAGIRERNPDPFNQAIYRLLLALWSGKSHIQGTAQAKDENEIPTVEGPRLTCLFATQSNTMQRLTKEPFFQASGLARRMDVFRSSRLPVVRDVDPKEAAERHADAEENVRQWMSWLSACQPAFSIYGLPSCDVELGPNVAAMRAAFAAEMHAKANQVKDEDEGLLQICRTATQKVTRWAAVHALGRCSLVVEEADWHYATLLFDAVQHSYLENVNAPDESEQIRLWIIDLVGKHGAMSAREMTRKKWALKGKQTVVERLANELCRSGEIESFKVGKSTQYRKA